MKLVTDSSSHPRKPKEETFSFQKKSENPKNESSVSFSISVTLSVSFSKIRKKTVFFNNNKVWKVKENFGNM